MFNRFIFKNTAERSIKSVSIWRSRGQEYKGSFLSHNMESVGVMGTNLGVEDLFT